MINAKIFDADFAQTPTGKRLRLLTRIGDMDKAEVAEYTIDDQLWEEAAVGII